MKISDLDFTFPEELIATAPQIPSRVMRVQDGVPSEISFEDFKSCFQSGDLLVVNNTEVLRRRVFSQEGLEILFLDSKDQLEWSVLFPSKKLKIGDELFLPKGIKITLIEKGRPQKVRASEVLPESYFAEVGELPLPPYIQKARAERHNQSEDKAWYQTVWAEKPGSFAAPTASLHFKKEDLAKLEAHGVKVTSLTLHVGLGTFLPVTTEDLNDHEMHAEYVEIPASTWQLIQETKKEGGRVWALGTTVTRSLESAEKGLLEKQTTGQNTGGFFGHTRLLIQPGFQFQVVDCLITNFHQPKSTLLALVAAFAGLETVKTCYQWAIERKFRLFSYGDLTLWQKTRN